MTRRTVRKSGRPLTPTEYQRRWRAKKKAKLKAQEETERRNRRAVLNQQLNIHPLAISEVSNAELASNSVDAVITDPPYAESDVPLNGELAHFAMRVLKPSGWCLAMVGDLYLGRAAMLEPHPTDILCSSSMWRMQSARPSMTI